MNFTILESLNSSVKTTLLTTCSALFLLTGCGGGGSDTTSAPTAPSTPTAPTTPPTPTPPTTPTPAPPVNIAPSVTVSAVTSVNEGDNISLSATASDEDGEITAFKWTQTAGPITLSLADASLATITVEAPQVEQDTQYSFQIEVTDNDGDVATDTIDVMVIDNKTEGIADRLRAFLVVGTETETLSPLANDITSSGSPVLVSVEESSLGTITINDDNTILFSAFRKSLGSESISYTAKDGNVEYTGQINISVSQYITLASYAGADGISSFPNAKIVTRVYSDELNSVGARTDERSWFNVGAILNQPTDVFTITMTGSADYGQASAQLTSIIGTAGEIIEASQVNSNNRLVIRETDLATIRPTHLSTAEEILLSRAIGNQPISDIELLSQAYQSINATSLIEYAAVIQLIAFDNTAIPEATPSASTSRDSQQGILTDITSRELFEPANEDRLDTFKQTNEAAIESASQSVVEFLRTAGGNKPLGKHVLVLRNRYLPNEWSGLWQFNEDDTGLFDSEEGSMAFEYEVKGNVVEAKFERAFLDKNAELFRPLFPDFTYAALDSAELTFLTTERDGVRCSNVEFGLTFYKDGVSLGSVTLVTINGGVITPRLVQQESFELAWEGNGLPDSTQTIRLVLPTFVGDKWQTDLFTLDGRNEVAEGLIFGQSAAWSYNDGLLSLAFENNLIEYQIGHDIDTDIVAQVKDSEQTISTKVMRAPAFVNSSQRGFDSLTETQVWTQRPSENQRSILAVEVDGEQMLAPLFQKGYRVGINTDGKFEIESFATQRTQSDCSGDCKKWEFVDTQHRVVDEPKDNFVRFEYGENDDGDTIYKDLYLFETSNLVHVIEVVWEDLNGNGRWDRIYNRVEEPISSSPNYFLLDIPYAPLD